MMSIFSLIKYNRKIIQAYSYTWLVIIVSVIAFSFFCLHELTSLPMRALLMIQAGVIVLLGYFVNPFWRYSTSRLFILFWSFCLVLAFIIVTLTNNASFQILFYIKLSLAVFLMSLSLFSLSRVMLIFFSNSQTIPWVIICMLMFFTTLPIWLAPWVEVIATTPEKLHIIIWSSPLTFLATALDYDYLRSHWFYQHTPYGMLRYNYPGLNGSYIVLTTVSLLLLAINGESDLKKDTHTSKGE